MRVFPSFRSLLLTGLVAVPGLSLVAVPASADRIKNPTAVFSGLDKITGRIINFEASVDETVQFGSLQLTARICYSRPEYENPHTTTFIEVDELGPNNQNKRVFAGWMFANSPGLNAIEHPVYDIWLAECKGGTEVIKSPPEVVEDEEPPPQVVDLKKGPKPGQPPVPGQRPAGPSAKGDPLRLPNAQAGGALPPGALPPGGTMLPPGSVGARQPQQRFFPTNTGAAPRSGGGSVGYDPGPRN